MDIAPGTVNPAQRNEEALRFLLTRRSRPPKTLHAPVPDRAGLNEILTAGLRVPDHGKIEPWRLVVFERAALDRLAREAEVYATAQGIDPGTAAKGASQFAQSPLCIAVIASPKPSEKAPEIEQMLSAGCVCLSLVNAALAAGWGAAWLTGWVAHDRGFAAKAFGLAPDEWVAGLIHIGTQSAEPPERPRPDVAALTAWVAE